jgi:hypothetical protein
MKYLSIGTTALMGLLTLLSGSGHLADAAPSPGTAPADGSLVLSFKARQGKGPEVSTQRRAPPYI